MQSIAIYKKKIAFTYCKKYVNVLLRKQLKPCLHWMQRATSSVGKKYL